MSFAPEQQVAARSDTADQSCAEDTQGETDACSPGLRSWGDSQVIAWLTPRAFCLAGFTLAWSPVPDYMAAVAHARPELHIHQGEGMQGKDRAWQ